MKFLMLMTLLSFPFIHVEARDPGTGSNTTVSEGAGPATPDAAPGATSVMGGGTPGNEGIDRDNIYNTQERKQEKMKQEEKDQKEDHSTQE